MLEGLIWEHQAAVTGSGMSRGERGSSLDVTLKHSYTHPFKHTLTHTNTEAKPPAQYQIHNPHLHPVPLISVHSLYLTFLFFYSLSLSLSIFLRLYQQLVQNRINHTRGQILHYHPQGLTNIRPRGSLR